MAKREGRGFAGMSPERQREIASMGGKKAHRIGAAHKWTRDEARLAGHKGGLARGKAFEEARGRKEA